VIAKPPGVECDTVSGGHYDSVPAGVGANDNASGTATVVELAAVVASRGQMGNNCFVLFGSEELGLDGSRAYVASLSQTQKNRLKGMLNFDMVGFAASNWQLIGSASMQDKGATVATRLGMNFARSGQHSGGSDHASFISAGIPALFLYAGQDPEWHQPGDTSSRIQPALLEQAADFGVAMLESLAAGG
jgi:aminopeptidase YwaD